MTLKTLGIAAGCALLAFGSGWYTGASGRTSIALELSETALRADVAEVRAALLDAQLSLMQSNFGDARRSLQRASAFAERAQVRLREVGRADHASGVQTVLAHLSDADRLSAALDTGAAQATSEALRALDASVPTTGP